jgi:histidine triad (HIT) family protein
MQDRGCIFCAIVAGDQPAVIVDEGERTLAFMDINPWARGHALVIPRAHVETVYEIDDADLTQVYVAARRVASRMTERLGCERVDMWNATGAAAFQVVPHFHLHLVPHYAGEPDLLQHLPRSTPEPGALEAIGASLRD